MEAVSTAEMSVNIYQTTRRNIPEDSHLHTLYLFSVSMFYSTTHSVAQKIQSRIIGWLMNNELGRLWEEAAVA
jgi:hypothetical protein